MAGVGCGDGYSLSAAGSGGEAWAVCCSRWVFTQELLGASAPHLKNHNLDFCHTGEVLLPGALISLPLLLPFPQPCRPCSWEHTAAL